MHKMIALTKPYTQIGPDDVPEICFRLVVSDIAPLSLNQLTLPKKSNPVAYQRKTSTVNPLCRMVGSHSGPKHVSQLIKNLQSATFCEKRLNPKCMKIFTQTTWFMTANMIPPNAVLLLLSVRLSYCACFVLWQSFVSYLILFDQN